MATAGYLISRAAEHAPVLSLTKGLDPETGELVKTQLQKAVHMQLMGGTNMGKSHQAISILTQLV